MNLDGLPSRRQFFLYLMDSEMAIVEDLTSWAGWYMVFNDNFLLLILFKFYISLVGHLLNWLNQFKRIVRLMENIKLVLMDRKSIFIGGKIHFDVSIAELGHVFRGGCGFARRVKVFWGIVSKKLFLWWSLRYLLLACVLWSWISQTLNPISVHLLRWMINKGIWFRKFWLV